MVLLVPVGLCFFAHECVFAPVLSQTAFLNEIFNSDNMTVCLFVSISDGGHNE